MRVQRREGKAVRIYLHFDLLKRMHALIRSGKFPAFQTWLETCENDIKGGRKDLSIYPSFISLIVDMVGNNLLMDLYPALPNQSDVKLKIVKQEEVQEIGDDVLDLLGDI
jgi:cell wall assembly regulator SMI1